MLLCRYEKGTVRLGPPEGGHYETVPYETHPGNPATQATQLPLKRIVADLELHHLALGPLAAFDVPHEVGAVVRPQGATLPPGLRIVDARVHAARVEAERIRHAQRDPLTRLRIEHQQRVGVRSVGQRRVSAEAHHVMPIHPVVIVEVGWDVRAFERRSVRLIERPALRAVRAVELPRAGE